MSTTITTPIVTLKLTRESGSYFRRISFTELPNWLAFASKLEEFYDIPTEHVAVSYVDDDNDKVVLRASEEFEEYIKGIVAGENKVVRLTVHDIRDDEEHRSATLESVPESESESEVPCEMVGHDEDEPFPGPEQRIRGGFMMRGGRGGHRGRGGFGGRGRGAFGAPPGGPCGRGGFASFGLRGGFVPDPRGGPGSPQGGPGGRGERGGRGGAHEYIHGGVRGGCGFRGFEQHLGNGFDDHHRGHHGHPDRRGDHGFRSSGIHHGPPPFDRRAFAGQGPFDHGRHVFFMFDKDEFPPFHGLFSRGRGGSGHLGGRHHPYPDRRGGMHRPPRSIPFDSPMGLFPMEVLATL